MTISAEELVGEELAGVLKGIRPGLVRDLAKLEGSTLEDLNVTIQVMPWGDRTVLGAYDAILIEGQHGIKALPRLKLLVSAASRVNTHIHEMGIDLGIYLKIDESQGGYGDG